MSLPPPGLHADVNGDGVVDHVEVFGGGGGGAGRSHAAVGADGRAVPSNNASLAGTPLVTRAQHDGTAREALFDGTACRGHAGVTRHGDRNSYGVDGAAGMFGGKNADVDVAPPAALRRGEETVVRSARRAVKARSPHTGSHTTASAW